MMGWTEYLIIEAICRHTEKELRDDETKKEELKLAAIGALNCIKKRVIGYGDGYIVFVLLAGIMIKKSWMIQEAKTQKELEEILKPSVPIWNYGNFITGPYHVLEEEVILWSEASLKAPLNDDAAKRYAKVFSQFFPKEAVEIWGKELAA